MKIVLIVGPSGIGKSSSLDRIKHNYPDCAFGNLDDLASIRGVELQLIDAQCIHTLRRHLNDDQLLLAFGMQTVGEFSARNGDKHVIVDVGAAFQDARSAQYLYRIHAVIALTADPDEAFERFVQNRQPRDREEFLQREFSGHRKLVYANANRVIDTNKKTLEQSAALLDETLRHLLETH